MTAARSISFLGLKNTTLPCNIIRDSTCILQLQSEKGQEDTEAINSQVKSHTKTKKLKERKKTTTTTNPSSSCCENEKVYVHSKYFTISCGVFQ